MEDKIYTIKESTLVNIANEIREKTETTEKENPLDMPALIRSIVGGGGIIPEGTKTITENGEYDVYSFANASVNVPTYPEPSGQIDIDTNGIVDIKDYATANVNVPQGITPTGTFEIESNGIFDITEYANVNVNVQGSTDFEEYVVNVNSLGWMMIPTNLLPEEIFVISVFPLSANPMVGTGDNKIVSADYYPNGNNFGGSTTYYTVGNSSQWGNLRQFTSNANQVSLDVSGIVLETTFVTGSWLAIIRKG